MTMRLTCDVIIVGGGPAGTAAALALQARGVGTLLVERTRYNSAWPGETLLGQSQPLLVALGVWERFLASGPIAVAPIISVWGDGEPRARPAVLDQFGPGWHVDRSSFDAMLARAAEAAGALVYCGVRPTKIVAMKSGWRVLLQSGAAETEVDARYIIDATGRSAWLARRIGGRQHHVDYLVGVVGTYARARIDTTLLVESAADGWWYSVPLTGERASAVYVTDSDSIAGTQLRTLYKMRLETTGPTRARLEPLDEPKLHVVPAGTCNLDPVAGERWLAVGDAAHSLDPLSGSGIYRALRSGLCASYAIAAALAGARGALSAYQRESGERFAAQLQARRHYYGLERRWPSSRFWSRRQA